MKKKKTLRSAPTALAGAISLIMAPPALAQISCPVPNSSSTTCTIEQSQGGDGSQVSVNFTGSSGQNDGYGGSYTVINNGARLNPLSPNLMVRLKGSAGSKDRSYGGKGGRVTISSSGELSADANSSSSYSAGGPGAWDDSGVQFSIYGASVGGVGANAATTVFGGGDGGRGGNGSEVVITNSGKLSLSPSDGGSVIYGGTIGGAGGDQDKAAIGNQKGGQGGDSNTVEISNSGHVLFSSSIAQNYAWGIAAETIGGEGGHDNGAGGSAGEANSLNPTMITNSGDVDVVAEGSNLSQGVRGLYVIGRGGNGATSHDGDDNGGAGGSFSTGTIFHSGSVNVKSNAVQAPDSLSALSGGIVLLGQGGNGGGGPSIFSNFTGVRGGQGGSTSKLLTATLAGGSSVSTSGDYLPGLSVLSRGGIGGLGYGDSHGGNGGAGGGVQVSLMDNAVIETDGMQSYGIIARSYGGAGGGVSSSSGFVDFTKEEAGSGGAGGTVTVKTGDVTQGSSGGSIRTLGAYSPGIVAQSMGGIGGSTTSSFQLIGNAGTDAGKGGASGTVTINSRSNIMTQGVSSHGIVAQAIGGGGGVAGESDGIIAVGSAGGSGVAGGTVNVDQSGDLATFGSGAMGILAQAIGGGGGDGGSSNGVAVIGGTGGDGGDGGRSTINVDGYTIKTAGDHGYGVVAQAIGGGGGTGGASSAYSAGPGFSMAVAVGGAGGGGGRGGAAAVNISNASIETGLQGAAQEDAHGVVVQSIGGGGGAGGDSMAKALAIAVPVGEVSFGVAVSFALGGTGGDGGSGSSAAAKLENAKVTTNGANSQGVVVQSIGGGGGLGGSASATSTVVGTGESISGSVQSSLGGNGGAGNDGGQASLTLIGSSIVTRGDSSNAILLQSLGGGGGAGGIGSATGRNINTDANVSISSSVGGSGESGGAGGTVSLLMDSVSSVTTYGDGARAALLQSIGGGGGASQGGQVGLDMSGSVENDSVDVHGSVSVGRNGAKGGNGGVINLHSDGDITTYGADADGLLVQSIGGSGGLAGAVGGDSATPSPLASVNDESTSYKFDVYVGGTGGAGGSGGTIGTSSAPAILAATTRTYGDYADAAVVQSIGGGGGSGGASTVSSSLSESNVTLGVGGRGGAGGRGGDITAYLDGNGKNAFNTEGYGAMGIVLQSIGGGGGMAGSGSPRARGLMSVGGIGGDNQTGGNITINNGSWAAVQTSGDSAHGIILQSIGGGGGMAMAGSTRSAANPDSQQFDLTAGNVSGGGNGGVINVSTGVNLNTYGDRAIGFIAQSIADGGGIVSTGAAKGIGSIALGSQRASNGGAQAGNVTLNLNYSLTTRGAGAHGIVAQSIGGGGGIVGDLAQAIQFDPAGFIRPSISANGGSGGAVSVSYDGTLTTGGANAHGIVAQSIGGGGGLAGGPQGGFAGSVGYGGVANTVSVTQSGRLQVGGAGSSGIFAQSDAGSSDAYNNSTVVINGFVQGGSGTGSGVWIASGKNNQLTVNTDGSLSALSGVAVRYNGKGSSASGSRLNIDNYGSLQGSVICGNADGANACEIDNHEGAVASDALLYNADVKNAGLIVVGNPGRFETLVVTGDLHLSDTSVLSTDVDFEKMSSSHMIVQGDADLAGSIDVMPRALLPNRELTVLTVQGALQGQVQAVDSPVFNFETRQDGPRTLIRVESADFNAASMGLGSNQSHVATYLQGVWSRGGNPALAPLFGQLDLAARQGADSYRESVAALSPGVSAAPAVQSAANLSQFTSTMMSCPVFTGVDAMTGEQNCFWGQASSRWTRQDGSDGAAGFDYDTVTYQFGGQREIRPDWFVGGSFAYESSRVHGSDGRVRGDGDSGYLGAVLKRQTGPWVFSAALGGGYGAYNVKRGIGIAGYQDTLQSRPDVYGFNARLRAARTFAYNNVYVKPYVDLDASYTRMPAYTESGSNPLALSVEGSDQFILGLSPVIELGGRAQLHNGATLRPYMYAGVSLLSKNNWVSRAQLRGAPASSASFNTSLPFDDVIGRVGAGLELTHKSGVDFRLQYDGQFSAHVRSHSVTLKAMVPF